MNILINDRWVYWTGGLMIAIPLLVILLNEAIHFFQQKNPFIIPPFVQIKNVVLPIFAIILLTTQVFQYAATTLFVKIISTVAWMLLLNALLSIWNIIVFETASQGSWRAQVPKLFLDLLRFMLVLFGGAIILSTVWGANLHNLATALGLGSFVLGLALQDTLRNLFSGIALYYEKPFKVGDKIKVDNHLGKVLEMNWRAVRILTKDSKMLIIPHLIIAKAPILNYYRPNAHLNYQSVLRFSYNDPPNKVKMVLLDCLKNVPNILELPRPIVRTLQYKESWIEYELEYALATTTESEAVNDALMTRIWYAVKRNQLNMPFPQLMIQQSSAVESPSIEMRLKELSSILPLDNNQIKSLKDKMTLQFYGVGELILQEQGVNTRIFIVVEGFAEQFTHTPQREEVALLKLEKGDFFGETALLGNRPSPVSVRAVSDLELLVIASEDAFDVLKIYPTLAVQLDEVMETRRLLKDQALQK